MTKEKDEKFRKIYLKCPANLKISPRYEGKTSGD